MKAEEKTSQNPTSAFFREVVDGLLAEGFAVRFRAGGRSMLPALRDGDLITVAPIGAGAVALGEVVLAATEHGLRAHRVRAWQRAADGAQTFFVRGDASRECDPPVDATAIRGKVVSFTRDGIERPAPLNSRWLWETAQAAVRALRPVLRQAVERTVAASRRSPSLRERW